MKKLYPILLMLAIILGSCSGDDSNEQLSNEPEVLIPPATNTPPNETPPTDEDQPGEEEEEGINGLWQITRYIDEDFDEEVSTACTYFHSRKFNPDMSSIYYLPANNGCDTTQEHGTYSINDNVLTITNTNNVIVKARILELTQNVLKLEYYYQLDSSGTWDAVFTLVYQRI